MNTDKIVGYVLGSSVRTDVLTAVVGERQPMDELIGSIEASESAVYNAVGDLERRGLVRSLEDGWDATGSGRLVADLLEQQENLCRLLEDDYWRTHDVGALPRRFRLRLTELAGADVFRATDTDPHAIVREVCDRVERAGTNVHIVTPIYQAEYEAVMPDSSDARLVVDTTVATEALDRIESPGDARQWEETPVRVLDVPVGVGVTDNEVMLSLPTIDGQYDSRTEVMAEDERAIEWGRDLFEYYWNRAVPNDEFIAEHFE
ncbi:helix-turn-helix transcriptional regulator [Halosimplex aquaticum]|uniref:Helix-turn-helix transcriptional regulator n=1 Tax=Halosimplex aquaticum TaxID=3026162 RepID=A0ABD5XYJ6_9EURY|nr:transcriptional regulator FilR1 domain-containing protein [Halosimplex aquaticum]